MTRKVFITIEREVEVELEFQPASRGARDSCGGIRGAGPALEPDEPATFEYLHLVKPLVVNDLEEDEVESAIEKALEEHNQEQDCEPED